MHIGRNGSLHNGHWLGHMSIKISAITNIDYNGFVYNEIGYTDVYNEHRL